MNELSTQPVLSHSLLSSSFDTGKVESGRIPVSTVVNSCACPSSLMVSDVNFLKNRNIYSPRPQLLITGEAVKSVHTADGAYIFICHREKFTHFSKIVEWFSASGGIWLNNAVRVSFDHDHNYSITYNNSDLSRKLYNLLTSQLGEVYNFEKRENKKIDFIKLGSEIKDLISKVNSEGEFLMSMCFVKENVAGEYVTSLTDKCSREIKRIDFIDKSIEARISRMDYLQVPYTDKATKLLVTQIVKEWYYKYDVRDVEMIVELLEMFEDEISDIISPTDIVFHRSTDISRLDLDGYQISNNPHASPEIAYPEINYERRTGKLNTQYIKIKHPNGGINAVASMNARTPGTGYSGNAEIIINLLDIFSQDGKIYRDITAAGGGGKAVLIVLPPEKKVKFNLLLADF